MWGLRAVLLNIGRGLTSLTIQMDILNSIDLTLRDLVFPNLERFQLISNWLDHDVYTVFYWLVHQSTPTGNLPAHPTLTFESDSEEDRTNKASSKLTNLRFIHLTFGANPSDCHRADSELNDLISATPSLEEITADVTMREYGIMAFAGEECLNRYFPRVYATGRLRHGKVDMWWEAK
ncbi:hypothetical protein D9757_009527 [Collybiopsis confluens]|uniref:Uncharacterized protein n=1 Tax=Collybiopsis confluens TaxID=2823264 RepID=A0A8H5H8I6_9AGAR|nr:hypothetical protein D9757_009527 [Collybiopsis confluens]